MHSYVHYTHTFSMSSLTRWPTDQKDKGAGERAFDVHICCRQQPVLPFHAPFLSMPVFSKKPFQTFKPLTADLRRQLGQAAMNHASRQSRRLR